MREVMVVAGWYQGTQSISKCSFQCLEECAERVDQESRRNGHGAEQTVVTDREALIKSLFDIDWQQITFPVVVEARQDTVKEVGG
jgi:hypothetical protein